jgi:hypothetical protein
MKYSILFILFFSLSYYGYTQSSGNVGIGTNDPQEKLHVVGSLRLEDGSESAGKVLSSDANGVATWVDPNTGLPVPDTALPVPIRYKSSYLFVHPTDNASAVDWATANSICSGLVAFGKSDWYLPSLNELNAMYKQSYLITGLEEGPSLKYWSSTEKDATNAWSQRLDYGAPDPDPKSVATGHVVRCVRKD